MAVRQNDHAWRSPVCRQQPSPPSVGPALGSALATARAVAAGLSGLAPSQQTSPSPAHTAGGLAAQTAAAGASPADVVSTAAAPTLVAGGSRSATAMPASLPPPPFRPAPKPHVLSASSFQTAAQLAVAQEAVKIAQEAAAAHAAMLARQRAAESGEAAPTDAGIAMTQPTSALVEQAASMAASARAVAVERVSEAG